MTRQHYVMALLAVVGSIWSLLSAGSVGVPVWFFGFAAGLLFGTWLNRRLP